MSILVTRIRRSRYGAHPPGWGQPGRLETETGREGEKGRGWSAYISADYTKYVLWHIIRGRTLGRAGPGGVGIIVRDRLIFRPGRRKLESRGRRGVGTPITMVMRRKARVSARGRRDRPSWERATVTSRLHSTRRASSPRPRREQRRGAARGGIEEACSATSAFLFPPAHNYA